MPSPPKPCAHCGSTTLQILPNLQSDLAYASTALGMSVSNKVPRVKWTYTLVICNQCGCTQMFTANWTQLAEHVPGAQIITVNPR